MIFGRLRPPMLCSFWQRCGPLIGPSLYVSRVLFIIDDRGYLLCLKVLSLLMFCPGVQVFHM